MNALLALALLYEGQVSYYNPNVMESVTAYRVRIGQILPCPACVGAVALMDCRDLGRVVWLDWGGGVIEGGFLVADCAQAEHRAWLAARDRVVEVDWPTALRHRMAGPVPVRVLWWPPEPRPHVGAL